ncbi:MAG: hypothetical protein IKP43_02150 [Bacteroidaceae bacterium]|nr:hypothetical protein [Bacteroidaceae bacterium]
MTTTKKLITLAILTLLPMMQMMAQSIEGKWKLADESKKEMEIGDGEAQGDVFLIFGQTDVSLIFQIGYSDDEFGTIGFEVSMPGEYKIEDNVINNSFNEDAADAQINKLDIKNEIKKAMDASPELKAQFITLLTQEFDKNKGTMIDGLKKLSNGISTMTIDKNDGATLTLKVGEKTIVMNKVE